MRIKTHFQQDPQKTETEGPEALHGTRFFGFLIKNLLMSQNYCHFGLFLKLFFLTIFYRDQHLFLFLHYLKKYLQFFGNTK